MADYLVEEFRALLNNKNEILDEGFKDILNSVKGLGADSLLTIKKALLGINEQTLKGVQAVLDKMTGSWNSLTFQEHEKLINDKIFLKEFMMAYQNAKPGMKGATGVVSAVFILAIIFGGQVNLIQFLKWAVKYILYAGFISAVTSRVLAGDRSEETTMQTLKDIAPVFSAINKLRSKVNKSIVKSKIIDPDIEEMLASIRDKYNL